MVYHIFSDQKFVDYTNRKLKEISSKRFRSIVLSTTKPKLCQISDDVIWVNPQNGQEVSELLSSINREATILAIHYLDKYKIDLLLKCDKQIRAAWFFWGADLYDDPFFFDQKVQYEESTLRVLNKKSHIKSRSKRILLLIKDALLAKRKTIFHGKRKERAIRKFDFFAPILSYEFQLVESSLTNAFKASMLGWQYGDIRYLVGDLFKNNNVKLGGNVLIGNSGFPKNNHLDLIETLKKTDLRCEIILPLNYGQKEYSDYVSKVFKDDFGTNCKVIDDFLPLNEYMKYLVSCQNMIMFHLRQQAIGNIVVGLYLGMKVFMNSKNRAFGYFKKLGFKIFDFEKDFLTEYIEPLKSADVAHNRSKLEEVWGEDVVLEKQIATIKRLENY